MIKRSEFKFSRIKIPVVVLIAVLLGSGAGCARETEKPAKTAETGQEKTEETAETSQEKNTETVETEEETEVSAETGNKADSKKEGETETEAETEAMSETEKETGEDLAGDGLLEDDISLENVTDEKLKTILTSIQNTMLATNGSWSAYLCDLVGDSEGSINDHCMQAASLIKLYIMGAVYENYETVISDYGQDTVDSYLYSMITVSDNDAANALTTYLGKGDSSVGMMIVNEFCMEHGFTQSSMGRLLLHGRENGDNYTSVEDCGRLLKKVYENDTAEFPHAEDMYRLLKAQERRNKIPSQMPEGVHVANKTGELDDVENDAGIIYDSQNDFVVVFMSENLGDVGVAQGTIGSLARQIYDYYNI